MPGRGVRGIVPRSNPACQILLFFALLSATCPRWRGISFPAILVSMNIARPPHGFDIDFTDEARAQFQDICMEPDQCRRIISLLQRLSVSGHIDGESLDDPDHPWDRQFAERGSVDWLCVVYTAKADTIRICSIKRFPA